MFQQKYIQPLKQLDDSVNEICLEVTDPFLRLKETLSCIQSQIESLNQFVTENPFENQSDEIYFYKIVKPQFVARSIFESERYHLEVHKPKGLNQTIVEYFKDELRFIDRFFKLHAFPYQYYKNEIETLDHFYFIKKETTNEHAVEQPMPMEANLEVNMEYLFAKFIAYERMQDCLIHRINMLLNPQVSISEDINNRPVLQWTGDSINLVEVAYGIWLTGQVNNGNASISEIVRFMEEAF
ncbi:MAG: RteC protein, partial [Daejeonella sp.]|nr:RteC protein [Daejeonella sp.]